MQKRKSTWVAYRFLAELLEEQGIPLKGCTLISGVNLLGAKATTSGEALNFLRTEWARRAKLISEVEKLKRLRRFGPKPRSER